MRTTARVLAVLSLCLGLGCAKKGDPVRETLDRMVKGANDRDAAAVMEMVAADFQGADGSSRADAETLLRRYFAAYEILNVTLKNVEIERSENAARVRLRAEMSGQPLKVGGLSGLLPSAAAYDFDFRMTRDGKQWKVAWGSWTQAAN